AALMGSMSSMPARTEVSEEQVPGRILRRHPPLKHLATRARHRKQVAVPGGLRRIARQGAVRAVVADKLFEVDEQRHASTSLRAGTLALLRGRRRCRSMLDRQPFVGRPRLLSRAGCLTGLPNCRVDEL